MTITAAGVPSPAIGLTDGLVPGLSVSGGANGSLTLSGLASVPQGTYTIPFQATNGTGTATQNFTLVLGATPQIVSANQFTDDAGVAETFTIHAAGNPAPSISRGSNFKLPHGYSFHDNGNGTATISGTGPGGSIYTYLLGGNVVASNSVGTATQQLSINFLAAPNPGVVGASFLQLATTFSSGIRNSFPIATTGAKTPVTISIVKGSGGDGPVPGWLGFQDNGNGTATFSGEPPPTATPYDVNIVFLPFALGQAFNWEYTLTIHVSAAQVFLDPANKLIMKCPVNQPCGMPVHTNMVTGALSLNGDVPAGLTLNAPLPNDGQLNFKTATGGAYPVTVNATDNYGSASEVYTFYILQAPSFPTANQDQLDI